VEGRDHMEDLVYDEKNVDLKVVSEKIDWIHLAQILLTVNTVMIL
jgi:hypothetical protein